MNERGSATLETQPRVSRARKRGSWTANWVVMDSETLGAKHKINPKEMDHPFSGKIMSTINGIIAENLFYGIVRLVNSQE